MIFGALHDSRTKLCRTLFKCKINKIWLRKIMHNLIALIVRTVIVRLQYYNINFRYKIVMQDAFFAYGNVKQSFWIFLFKNVTQSSFFI